MRYQESSANVHPYCRATQRDDVRFHKSGCRGPDPALSHMCALATPTPDVLAGASACPVRMRFYPGPAFPTFFVGVPLDLYYILWRNPAPMGHWQVFT